MTRNQATQPTSATCPAHLHHWQAVSCERVESEDFEMEDDTGRLVYFIVEKTSYECVHCGAKNKLLSSRPD
jgi:hypothetical protein